MLIYPIMNATIFTVAGEASSPFLYRQDVDPRISWKSAVALLITPRCTEHELFMLYNGLEKSGVNFITNASIHDMKKSYQAINMRRFTFHRYNSQS